MISVTVCQFKWTAQLTPQIIWWNAILQQQVRRGNCKIMMFVNMHNTKILQPTNCNLKWKKHSLEWSETAKQLREEWSKPSRAHQQYRLASLVSQYANDLHMTMWKSDWKSRQCNPQGHACMMHLSSECCKLIITLCKTVDHILTQ